MAVPAVRPLNPFAASLASVWRVGRSGVRWIRRWIVKPAALPSMVIGIALLLPAATLLVSVWLSGWQLQVVQTNSMWPTYPTGTLVVAEPVAPADVRPGDVLTFSAPWRNRALVTHRVRAIELDADGARTFITRGDASDADDPSPLPEREARTIARWGIPKLGALVWALRGWRGVLLLVVLPLTLLAAGELREFRRRRRTKCDHCGGVMPRVAHG